ncbi:MAG: hypothetical protein CMG01_06265 [Candidatus Marinimicrobia bacterium]|nr:hypothetical protein [Candidatus Neomarinimicrobiota bacterium]
MKNYLLLLSACFVFANNQYPTESQINHMIEQSMQLIWETAMEGKKTLNSITPNVREELLSNLCSSAPNINFHILLILVVVHSYFQPSLIDYH